MPDLLTSLPVVADRNAMARRWVYPDWGKFWSFEPSRETESWCRYFGYGHEVYEPGAFMMGGRLVIHPDLLAQIPRIAEG